MTIKSINYEKIYYYSVLLFAFLLPLSRAAVSFFVILLPIVWLIEGNLKAQLQKIKSNKTLVFLFLFISFTFISILWTQHYDDAKRPLRLLSYFFALFVIATSFNPKYTDKVISAFLSGMFISEIIAYGVFFRLWTFKHATPQYLSPFMHHIDYSVFLAFTSILLLNRLISSKYPLKEKIFYGFFFFTVTGNLFLSPGRTGQVALIVAIFVMFSIHFRVSIKAFLLSILFITTIFFTSYNVSPIFNKRVHQASNDIEKIMHHKFNSSWGIRAAFWITSLNIVQKNPLIGVGIGDFYSATKHELEKQKYKDISTSTKNFMSTNTPHNQYLLILMQTGVIGFTLFLFFIYYFIKLPIRDKEIKEISLLFSAIFFTSFIADTLLMQQFPLALFIVFIGLFNANSFHTSNRL
jgi:O-antigen ligase